MSVYDSDESSCSHPSSFSDQSFKALVGTTLHPSRDSGDSENNGKACKTIACDSLGDTGKPKEGYLSTIFSCSLFQKDIYAGKVVTYPKCMHKMLSSMYPEILSVLEETYRWGAFIYVGGSFHCLFPRHPNRFHKIKTELICDMCIFANHKPAVLLTVAKNRKRGYDLTSYNLQMKRNLEEWISKTLVEFKALSVVVTPDDFRSREHFKRKLFNVETQSPTKVLPSTLVTLILTMETFLRKLATCKFVQRFSGVSEETVYFDQDVFEEFIELMEEKNTKTVYPKCSDYTMLLACELGYRLALIGHTSIYSRSEEKREFEELRKAQNLYISINYDRSHADDNLEEGDVLLSSWKGGRILFRAEIAAARRTLASAVVNRSAKVQDEEKRNRLMELVCLNMKRAEEQLENTLRRADSKSQIAEMESFSIYSRDEETQMYTVGTDAVSRSLTPEILGFKDGTVQEDLHSQNTDSQTSESCNHGQMAKIEEAKNKEYPLGHFDHMAPSQSTQRDKAMCISSARLDKQMFSHLEGTMHNLNTSDWRARKRDKDQTHLQKWLDMSRLRTTSKKITEGQPTRRRDPTYPNRISRSDSEGTQQRNQSFSKRNKNPADYQYTTLEGEQLLNIEQRFPWHHGRQPSLSKADSI
ncbi:uncharacterized protein LOC124265331 isoform X3 [Haliotis rubra]|uniref:uncharacterized protein LOC124265331 isoform X3 n=1 Tax=Haliotis rubra TaxID=36100 RepID=UPI001EE4F983|nr:uncharacterized protein LOC124265331 isoform X3 [Haliotis rubra]